MPRFPGCGQRFGEIGDQRLTIMAAITLADEWSEANDRVRELEVEIARLKGYPAAAPEWAEKVAVSLGDAAQRIERVVQELNESSKE